jgi:anti-sigma factor RsiW
MRDDHIGENAELYALGELNELEAARIERHARTCAQCAHRLGEAEATVLQLIEAGGADASVPEALDRRIAFAKPAPPARGWIAAVAAAFVIGLLPWGWTVTQRHPNEAAQPAIDAMLVGHFVHAPLLPLQAGAPSAKVIYAREGGWIYVLAAAGPDSLDVATVTGDRVSVVGELGSSGATRAAFVKISGRVDSVELLENGKPISAAHLVYAR